MPWVLIPIIAIVVSGLVKFMEHRTKQLSLQTGQQDHDLEGFKAQLAQQQALLAKRIENLEVIISSQTWETMHDPKLTADEKKFLLEENKSELERLAQSLTDEQKIELLSKQVR
jgi:uncharacterized coiled-coil protein SlyX